MVLSDGELWDAINQGKLRLKPLPDTSAVQPSSIDLKLYRKIRVHRQNAVEGIEVDPATVDMDDHIRTYTKGVDLRSKSFPLAPHTFVIGQTTERVTLPLEFAARIEGKSSLGRLGVTVHMTAPKIDPGFDNRITLEIYNFGSFTLKLSEGMKICVLIVERLGQPAKLSYAGRFQGS